MKGNVYKYAINSVLAITIGFSAFLILSDNVAPFTTQATVHKPIANIAPEVSGKVTAVYITNGDNIRAGSLLFSIDKEKYQLAVEKAESQLQQAIESNQSKEQLLASSKLTLVQRQLELIDAKKDYHRYLTLDKKGLTNKKAIDDAKVALDLAINNIEIAKSNIEQINIELNHGDNAAMKIARDNVASARLDLSNTDIKSTIDGIVTNLQLQKGSYINASTPSLFVVNNKAEWVSADFNEKGISHLNTGNATYVVFDALPGHVFDGKIMSKDSAVFDVYNPTNQLASVENDDRWIRNQQKIRTRITVDNMNDDLISGSRATVMVVNGNPIIDAVGVTWMHFVSLFRYVY